MSRVVLMDFYLSNFVQQIQEAKFTRQESALSRMATLVITALTQDLIVYAGRDFTGASSV